MVPLLAVQNSSMRVQRKMRLASEEGSVARGHPSLYCQGN